MREIKLKLDKKFDIKPTLKNYFIKNNVEEFYEKKFIESNKTITVYAYETKYLHKVWGNKTPTTIFVSTTIISTMYDNLTELSIVESTDNKDNISNSIFLVFKDLGFYA